MKFFDDYNALTYVTCIDLPGPDRKPWFNKGGVITVERHAMVLRIVHYELDNATVTARLQLWFTQIHELLRLANPNLVYYKNTNGQIGGIESLYETPGLRRKVEDFIFMPFSMLLNFPYVRRFHLVGLPLSGGRQFGPDDTWVRLTVFNDKLAFCLAVNHEGHDYTLTNKEHKTWAIRLMADLGIESYSIEWEADFFLASAEDFERLYEFLTLHAVATQWH